MIKSKKIRFCQTRRGLWRSGILIRLFSKCLRLIRRDSESRKKAKTKGRRSMPSYPRDRILETLSRSLSSQRSLRRSPFQTLQRSRTLKKPKKPVSRTTKMPSCAMSTFKKAPMSSEAKLWSKSRIRFSTQYALWMP